MVSVYTDEFEPPNPTMLYHFTEEYYTTDSDDVEPVIL